MEFQDEQESQIEPFLRLFDFESPPPPCVPQNAQQSDVVREQQANANIQEACSDDTVLGHEIASTTQEHLHHESCDSLVKDTQFASVELDTQGTDRFDMPLARCDPTDNPESGSTRIISSNMQRHSPPFKRPTAEVNSPKFQFGPGPNPGNMKLTRIYPGTASSADHRSTSKIISQHNAAVGSTQNRQYMTTKLNK